MGFAALAEPARYRGHSNSQKKLLIGFLPAIFDWFNGLLLLDWSILPALFASLLCAAPGKIPVAQAFGEPCVR